MFECETFEIHVAVIQIVCAFGCKCFVYSFTYTVTEVSADTY
jgi:hypothetical protein